MSLILAPANQVADCLHMIGKAHFLILQICWNVAVVVLEGCLDHFSEPGAVLLEGQVKLKIQDGIVVSYCSSRCRSPCSCRQHWGWRWGGFWQ
jgi:hypothetical protein